MLQDLVRELLPALIPLALAIFCLFAVLGPVTDVLAGGSQPPASRVVAGARAHGFDGCHRTAAAQACLIDPA